MIFDDILDLGQNIDPFDFRYTVKKTTVMTLIRDLPVYKYQYIGLILLGSSYVNYSFNIILIASVLVIWDVSTSPIISTL